MAELSNILADSDNNLRFCELSLILILLIYIVTSYQSGIIYLSLLHSISVIFNGMSSGFSVAGSVDIPSKQKQTALLKRQDYSMSSGSYSSNLLSAVWDTILQNNDLCWKEIPKITKTETACKERELRMDEIHICYKILCLQWNTEWGFHGIATKLCVGGYSGWLWFKWFYPYNLSGKLTIRRWKRQLHLYRYPSLPIRK